LYRERFTEIHSPKIVAEGAEGGANIFQLDYFGKQAYLAQSPQFYKQMMVGVFERVFEIAPVFRAEKHDTARHLNEYTGVDFEMGFIESFEEIMQMETAMLCFVMEYLQEQYGQELTLLKVQLPEIRSIPAVKFSEAKEMVAKAYHREIKDKTDFEPEEEKLLCELIKKQTGSEFVFVTHYPSKKRPFYAMEAKENPAETLSFDLLFRGLEVTTGGQRIHGYEEQVAKLKRLGMAVELFESYLMMHKHGMPPHGGMGLGLERLTAKLLGFENVRYATLFPRGVNRLTP
jgi:nondiscriminating aspartyl-tRNA synthetase